MPNPLVFPCSNRRACKGVDLPIENYSSEDGEPGPPYWGVAYPDPPKRPPRDFFQKMGCLFMCTSWNSQAEVDACVAAQTPFCDTPPPGFFYAWGCKSICVSSISQADADACAEAQLEQCQNEQVFEAEGCIGICTSYVSQADANLCALRQVELCANPDEAVTNEEQCCTRTLADGTIFTYCIPAGTLTGPTQAEANARALAFACAVIDSDNGSGAGGGAGTDSNGRTTHGWYPWMPDQPFRLGGPSDSDGTALSNVICKDVAYAAYLNTTPATAVSFAVISGSLPPGLTLQDVGTQAYISGTPTTTGAYTFTVRATKSSLLYADRTCTLTVVGINTDSPLPDGTVGSAYSELLVGGGGTSYLFALTTGELPTGLSLSPTGAITGTPTTAGTEIFTVSMTTGDTTCSKDFSLTIIANGTASVIMARRTSIAGPNIEVGLFGSSYFLGAHVGLSLNGIQYWFYDDGAIVDVDPLDGYGSHAAGYLGFIPLGTPRPVHGLINTVGLVVGSVSASLDAGSTPLWPGTVTIDPVALAAMQVKQPTLAATLTSDLARPSTYYSADLSVELADGHTIIFTWVSGGAHQALYKRHDCSTLPTGIFYFNDLEDFGLASITLT